MLQAQVNYWNLVENSKHNRATEAQAVKELEETTRHNLATEKSQAKQALASLRQAAAATKNANTNLFIARYNKDLGYKNLAVNRQNAASNAKQAQAALKNAESNALQASAAWKNALTNAYSASMNARYQQEMAAVSQYQAKISADRNEWQKNAQRLQNMTEIYKQDLLSAQTSNYRGLTDTYQYLNELRKQQAATEQFKQAGTVADIITGFSNSGARWVDAFIPF